MVYIDKTLIPYLNENGGTSTFTLPKLVADNLPPSVGDVHAWVQTQFDDISLGHKRFDKYINRLGKQGKNLSRRDKGDIIRSVAFNVAAHNIVF